MGVFCSFPLFQIINKKRKGVLGIFLPLKTKNLGVLGPFLPFKTKNAREFWDPFFLPFKQKTPGSFGTLPSSKNKKCRGVLGSFLPSQTKNAREFWKISPFNQKYSHWFLPTLQTGGKPSISR